MLRKIARGAMIGKNQRFERRTKSEVHQCDFVLLRPIQADRHIVHRPLFRKHEGKHDRQNARQPPYHQELARPDAFERGGRRERVVESDQFMEIGGAGAPMAEDEDRRRVDRRGRDTIGKNQVLDAAQRRIHDRHRRYLQHQGEPRGRNGVAMLRQQPAPTGRRDSVEQPEREQRMFPLLHQRSDGAQMTLLSS